MAVRTGDKKPKDISLLIAPKNTPGLSFGKKDNKMCMRGSVTADMVFEDGKVPEENRIGKEGEGWGILTNFSNSMRCWGAASIGLGVAQAAFEYAVKYSKERIQFGKPIAEFQAIQFMLADMEMHIEAARSLIHRANLLVDNEDENVSNKTMAMVSMAKCYATDVAMKVTTDAVQILGGYGVMKEYPVQRMMRDAKAGQIYDGSNQIQRMIIAKSLLKRY